MTERLVAVAIMRNGELLKAPNSTWSHAELRGWKDPVPTDTHGFMTSAGRFVDRREARDVALAAGQIDKSWRDAKRDLLSSDVRW